MKRPEPDSPDARRRAEEAADWLVRRDRGLTAAEQDEFLQWLAADSRHGEWLALHRHTVGDFTALVTWRPEHSEEPNPDLLAPSRPRRIRWLVPTVLAAAAAFVLAFVWHSEPASPALASVAHTGLRRRILADGSTIELNRGATVNVEFTAAERRVTLVRGEAFFTVAKNPARPFVVRADGVDVRAVGTAFTVRLDSAAVEVLVDEGRVSVAGKPARSSSGAVPPVAAPPAFIDAGQRATVSLTSGEPPRVVAATPQQIGQHLAWQPQLLDFSSAPLAAAVAEFNRRNRVQFVIADEELAAMPIVASIRSDNVEGFAQFLAAAPGVQIERRNAAEIVVHRKQ